MASQKTFSVLEHLVRMTELLHTTVISKERVKRSSNFQCYTYLQSGWPNKIQVNKVNHSTLAKMNFQCATHV